MCACAGGVLRGIRETHIVLQLAHIMSQPEHRGPPRLLARRPGGAPGRRRRATLAGRTRTRAVCGCRRGGRRGRSSDDGPVIPWQVLQAADGLWMICLMMSSRLAVPEPPILLQYRVLKFDDHFAPEEYGLSRKQFTDLVSKHGFVEHAAEHSTRLSSIGRPLSLAAVSAERRAEEEERGGGERRGEGRTGQDRTRHYNTGQDNSQILFPYVLLAYVKPVLPLSVNKA